MKREKCIALVEHTTAARHVLPTLQADGFKILYLGLDPELSAQADHSISHSPLSPDFLSLHGHTLREMNLAGVYSLLEHAKMAENKISTFLGCESASIEALNLSRDKLLMRAEMKRRGLDSVDFQFILDGTPVPEATLAYPFIVKPNSGFASGGVQLVRNRDEYLAAVNVARRLNRFVLGKEGSIQTGVLCEEYIVGPEFSVDAITVKGETEIFCICGRGFVSDENYQDFLYYSSPELPEGQSFEDVKKAVGSFLRAMKHEQGPSHTEMRFDIEKRRWIVLESGLRVGFAGNIGRLIEELSGVHYNTLALRAHIGELSIDELRASKKPFDRHGFVFTPATGPGGIVKEVRGLDFLERDPRIRFFDLQKGIGDAVVPYPKGLEYLGVIIGVDATREKQSQLAALTAEKVSFHYA